MLELTMVQCNIDEELVLTTAKLMKTLGLQVRLLLFSTDYILNNPLRLLATSMSTSTTVIPRRIAPLVVTLSKVMLLQCLFEVPLTLLIRQSPLQEWNEKSHRPDPCFRLVCLPLYLRG